MLQVVQYQKTGKLSVEEFPVPQIKVGHILVRNVCSIVSSGTERTSVETAQASLLGKAKARPDLVKQVLDNVKKEGLAATYGKVKNRLGNIKELGYSSAGIVVESMVDGIKVGDKVACAGTAYHAEYVLVPKHLITRIPETLDLSEAAFTTLGAIALQGVRQADVRVGETVAVIGLGLIGLLTVQILKANGCRVIGLDIADGTFDLATQLGSDLCLSSNPQASGSVRSFTRGYGCDAVIVSASTPSNEPVELALQLLRKRGRVVVVGSVKMDIPRQLFFEKEADLRISTSYGPGRYDPEYESEGHDYPIGYVRWTENRNMEAVVQLMVEQKLTVAPLITHRFPIREALKAYDVVTGKSRQRSVGVLIDYPEEGITVASRRVDLAPHRTSVGQIVAGFIGAGNFAQSYLLPPLKASGVRLKGVVTGTSVHSKSVAEKFGFEFCSTDPDEILNDKDINTVFIATRHDTHASFVKHALAQGKHVFVEKPLAISRSELDELSTTRGRYGATALMVGFNRRFSAPLRDMKAFLKNVHGPLMITYRMNAGALPPNHWAGMSKQGGRIIGEACHIVDCMTYLTGSKPISVVATPGGSTRTGSSTEDVIATISFANGSVGNLIYVTGGDTSLPKEYCEIHGGGISVVMDNFQRVLFHTGGKVSRRKYDGTKGHREEMRHFLDLVAGKVKEELSFESMSDTTMVTFLILESSTSGAVLRV